MSDQSSVPLLDDGDIESKPVKVLETKIATAAEETPFNTQAFWLLVWMAKYEPLLQKTLSVIERCKSGRLI